MVSPSLLSLSSVEQVARRLKVHREFLASGVSRCVYRSSLLNLNIIVHVQGNFADLKFTVFARSKQASIDTHALRNEVTLVWGSLTLAPITVVTKTKRAFTKLALLRFKIKLN